MLHTSISLKFFHSIHDDDIQYLHSDYYLNPLKDRIHFTFATTLRDREYYYLNFTDEKIEA